MNEAIEKTAEEIAALHELNMRQLLREQLIDPDDFINDPKKYTDKGYRFIHETEGDKHTIVIAKVIAEKRYAINVTATPSPQPQEGKTV